MTDHEDRLTLARLNFMHMQQSIVRALEDPEFAAIMTNPFRNPSPSLEDLSPHRTLN
jgi:hypothetical protein